MNDSNPASPETTGTGPADKASAVFQTLIAQQTNMAMMCLGQLPHPETGQSKRDLEAARFFIDQIEMLEAKTKGNLDPQETAFLKQSLTMLRMAFVEAVNKPEPGSAGSPAPAPAPAAGSSAPADEPGEGPGSESRKKFSKKYE